VISRDAAGRCEQWRPAFINAKAITVAGLIVAFIGCGFFPLHVLKIDALRKNETVYMRVVRPDDRLALGFIHSVEHCPVRDYFSIDGSYRLVLRETTFASSNTGLPYSRGPNETLVNEGNQFRLGNRHILFSSIDLWVDQKYDNVLFFGKEEKLKLPSLAGNTLLRVSTAEIAAVRYLLYRAKNCFYNES
jgi:hypothetical protein